MVVLPAAAFNIKLRGVAGAALLGDLTALRSLKFDTATHGPVTTPHQLSDTDLRQLARLRLTSLSLPGLCDVR